MASTWAQALLATPPVILGRRLRPFSLSHSALLTEIDSPYAYRGAPADERELFAAVEICARTHAENLAAFGGGFDVRRLRRWRRQWRRVAFTVADASFRQYLADYSRRNKRNETGGDGERRDLGGPIEWHLHRHLTEDRCWADGAAWDCPLNYAWALMDVSHEWRAPGLLQSEYDARLEALLATEAEARGRGDMAGAAAAAAEIQQLIREHQS